MNIGAELDAMPANLFDSDRAMVTAGLANDRPDVARRRLQSLKYRIGIDPARLVSIIRLAGAILTEQNDEWHLQHRYMTSETITGLADDLTVRVPVALTNAA